MENWKNLLRKVNLWKKKGCSKKEASVKVFLDETDHKEKFKLLDHIFSCQECFAEFEDLKEIWTKENDILLGLGKGKLTKENALQLKQLAEREITTLKSKEKAGKNFLFLPKKIIAVALGIFAVFLVSLFIQIKDRENTTLQRHVDQRNFEVSEPWGEINESKIFFRWPLIRDAKSYALEILDSGLDTFYYREGIKSSQFILPDEIYASFIKDKTYFWKVIATLKNSQKIESEFGKFLIKSN